MISMITTLNGISILEKVVEALNREVRGRLLLASETSTTFFFVEGII